ncbi:MAG TPA: amino acid--tRNA ligase-related protein, partial [Thermohalobaculum sp.]|nr:amino acid--tRNA ligase-related protein [Thermohalobaculum sp.]
YQLDMEMSFVTQEDVFNAIEPVLAETFAEFAGFGRERPWKITSGGTEIDVTQPQGERHAFRRIPYTEAMEKYATDKPDLRNPIEMREVSEHFRDSGFQVFAKILERQGTEIRAIPAPTGGSRAFCDRMNAWAQKEGLPGMGYIFWREKPSQSEGSKELSEIYSKFMDTITKLLEKDEKFEGLDGLLEALDGIERELSFQPGEVGGSTIIIRSHHKEIAKAIADQDFATADNLMNRYSVQIEAAGPLARNIGPERTEAIRQELDLGAGDAAFFLAGTPKSFIDVAAKARNVIADELGLAARDRFDFCWVVDFPMFEWNEEEEKIDFSHNPFSMPQGGLEALESEDPLAIRGFQYDIVCNGVELSSGAIRNHRPEIMYKAFEIAGYGRAEVEARFGGMLNAFRYGAPPHGGIAPGIDRIVMLLAGVSNIREVIMFPMNQRAEDLLMQAPSQVGAKQLRELNIRIVPQE